MILEVGACYQVVAVNYGVVDENAQHTVDSDLYNNDIFTVLEHIKDIKTKGYSPDILFHHYKILANNKIQYILVLTKHNDLDNFLKKII